MAGPGTTDLVPGPAGHMDADLSKLPRFTSDVSGLFLFCIRFCLRGVERCKPTPGGDRAAPQRGQ
jgi:hypothetical protein